MYLGTEGTIVHNPQSNLSSGVSVVMSWGLLLLALDGSTSQFSTPVSVNAFSTLAVSSWSWTLTLRASLSVAGTVGGAVTVAVLSALVEMSSGTLSAGIGSSVTLRSACTQSGVW